MARAQEVEFVTGEQAVYLWHLWERKGKRNALELLKRYNQEDTKNLEPIAALAYERLMRSVLDCGGGEDARGR